MRGLSVLVLVAALTGSAATADPVTKSPRPMPRPTALIVPAPVAQTEMAVVITAALPKLRPLPRPAELGQAPLQTTSEAAPRKVKKPTKRNKKSAKGSVCSDPDIKGVALARIKAKVKGCGIEEPVSVTSVDGIRLSQPSTLDCATAAALKTWVQQSMRPAFGNREVVELRIAAHYICRPRNNIKGNKISEHGRGRAIDIAGFVFSDGKSWTIARDYNKQIRKAHKGACGIFGTTLGPGSDGYHEDHLHFDTANHRGKSYCR